MLRWSLGVARCAPRVSGMRGVRAVRHPLPPAVIVPRPVDTSPGTSNDASRSSASTAPPKTVQRVKHELDGHEFEETVYNFPAPSSSSPPPPAPSTSPSSVEAPSPSANAKPRTASAAGLARWMRAQLSSSDDKSKRGDLGRVLAAAHHFLNHHLGAESDHPARADAYTLFLAEFLRHSRGASPAVSLIRRQIAERVPMSAEGAVVAFKAARNRAPRLRDILPIVPRDVTVELIYIYASALVEEGQAPAAVREMIGTSLAAVRNEAAAAQASQVPSSSSATDQSSSPPDLAEVPPHEWDFELHLPLINAHFATSDFRGALRALNDLRTGARMAREKALEEGRAWPGAARRPIVNCYTAIMSLWVRSMFAGYTGHGRAGRRLGSGVPHRLAVDLGNLLAPVPAKSARQGKRQTTALAQERPETAESTDAGTKPPPMSATLLTTALADGNPMLSLTAGSDLQDAKPRRYRHLQPFLAAWFNAERVAGNTELAAAVWEQISGQTVAQSVAGYEPPFRPSPDAYVILLKLLKAHPPPSFRPLVATILDDGKGEITPDLLDALLSCVAAAPIRATTDWSSIASPWPSTVPTPTLSTPPPPPAPAPDLALAFVLLEEHKPLLRARSLNLAGAAIIHAARRGANPTRYRGEALRHVLSAESGTGPSIDEFTWLNIVLWDTEKAEALRSGRPPLSLPAFPLGAASVADVEAANIGRLGGEGQMLKREGRREGKSEGRDEGEGEAHPLPPLVQTVLPAMRRLLLNTVLVAARQRGVEGPASEIFMGELRALQDDMRGDAAREEAGEGGREEGGSDSTPFAAGADGQRI